MYLHQHSTLQTNYLKTVNINTRHVTLFCWLLIYSGRYLLNMWRYYCYYYSIRVYNVSYFWGQNNLIYNYYIFWFKTISCSWNCVGIHICMILNIILTKFLNPLFEVWCIYKISDNRTTIMTVTQTPFF